MAELEEDRKMADSEETIQIDSIVVASGDCLSTTVKGETILMSIGSGSYGSLGEIGSDIFRRLQTPISVRELCSAMVSEYQGDPEVIQVELLQFLNSLLNKKAIALSP